MGRVAARMAPTRTGNFTFWLDIAVAAGFTDKLWPGTNAHQRRVLTVQHSPGLLHIHHQLRLARDRRAKIRGWLHVCRRSALNGQAGVGPRLPAAIQNPYIPHARVEHDLRHARGGIHVATVQNDGGIVTDPVLRQHRFQLFVRDLIPQRFAFHFIGVDIARVGNVAQEIKLRRTPASLDHLPLSGWCGGNGFALLQQVDPLRINQLFKMCQTLQTVGLLQGIAQDGNVGKTRFFQPRFDGLVVIIIAIERNRHVGRKPMLFCPAAELFIAHCPKPAGREIKCGGLVPGRSAQGLRPAVIERTDARINYRAILRLKLSQREGVGHISRRGGE